MREGLSKLQISLNERFDDFYIKNTIDELLEKNQIQKGAKARITVFRRGGGQYTPLDNSGSILIETETIDVNEYDLNKEGYIVDLYERHTSPSDFLSSIKSNSALFSVIAALYIQSKELDEAILLNEMGCISEGISTNIFIVFNSVLYTPSDDQGCLPGILRDQLITIAKKNRIEVQECQLNPSVLLKADELLFTNAVSGIRWALSYRNKRFYNNMAKKLVELLNKEVAN